MPPTSTLLAPRPGRAPSARPRAVHVALRDGSSFDGKIFLLDNQSLALFLDTRKGGWVNVVDVVWTSGRAPLPHLVLQTAHVLLVVARDDQIASSLRPGTRRFVHCDLDGAVQIRGSIALTDGQRMNDYLGTIGTFLPMVGADRLDTTEHLGDVAINASTIRLVYEMAPPTFQESIAVATARATLPRGMPALTAR